MTCKLALLFLALAAAGCSSSPLDVGADHPGLETAHLDSLTSV